MRKKTGDVRKRKLTENSGKAAVYENREEQRERRMKGYIDIHSHILPGLDDGSKDMEQSLAMLQIAREQGIETIVATPHHMPGKGRPDRQRVQEVLMRLQDAAQERGIPVRLCRGCEYYFREEVLELLEAGEGITLGSSDCVLVEFNVLAETRYIQNAVRAIRGLGYYPVIAHVERYESLIGDMELLAGMRKMGAYLQVNASSVLGENGRKIREKVKKLLKYRLVDVIGTDAHSDRRRGPYLRECAEYLYKKYPSDYADSLLYGTAGKWL